MSHINESGLIHNPKDVKLREYLDDAINTVSNDYVELTKIGRSDLALETIKYRNILLTIREICKARKKF